MFKESLGRARRHIVMNKIDEKFKTAHKNKLQFKNINKDYWNDCKIIHGFKKKLSAIILTTILLNRPLKSKADNLPYFNAKLFTHSVHEHRTTIMVAKIPRSSIIIQLNIFPRKNSREIVHTPAKAKSHLCVCVCSCKSSPHPAVWHGTEMLHVCAKCSSILAPETTSRHFRRHRVFGILGTVTHGGWFSSRPGWIQFSTESWPPWWLIMKMFAFIIDKSLPGERL